MSHLFYPRSIWLIGLLLLGLSLAVLMQPFPSRAASKTTNGPQSVSDAPIIPVIDAAYKARLRAILAAGAARGNRPAVFAKIGDSITESGSFLMDFGCGVETATLGDHGNLLPVIDYFKASELPASYTQVWCGAANAFTRASASATAGWTANRALEPAENPLCESGENALGCELRLLKPALALIMYGTNDLEAFNDPARFDRELTQIVSQTIAAGVIPVLSTIPPRRDSVALGDRVASYNQVVLAVAAANHIPLWNYWRALQASSLLNHGLSEDGIHPNLYNGSEATNLTADGLRYGYNQRNLTALQVLAKLKTVVIDNGPPDASANPSAEPTATATAQPTTIGDCPSAQRRFLRVPLVLDCRIHLPLVTKAPELATPQPTATATETSLPASTTTPTNTPVPNTPVSHTPTPITTPAPVACAPIPGGAVTLVTLGDSLTEGDGDDGGGGFPARLITRIQTVRAGSTVTNLGKSGWSSDALISGDQGLPSQLTSAVDLLNQAKTAGRIPVATVWIGSNDLWYLYDGDSATPDESESGDAQRYSNNLDQIIGDLRATGATVFVALLDDQSQRPVAVQGQAFPGVTTSELALMAQQVDRYNTAARSRATQHGASVVDFFHTTIFSDPATLAGDGNHPNPAGYDQITNLWFAALQAPLAGCNRR